MTRKIHVLAVGLMLLPATTLVAHVSYAQTAQPLSTGSLSTTTFVSFSTTSALPQCSSCPIWSDASCLELERRLGIDLACDADTGGLETEEELDAALEQVLAEYNYEDLTNECKLLVNPYFVSTGAAQSTTTNTSTTVASLLGYKAGIHVNVAMDLGLDQLQEAASQKQIDQESMNSAYKVLQAFKQLGIFANVKVHVNHCQVYRIAQDYAHRMLNCITIRRWDRLDRKIKKKAHKAIEGQCRREKRNEKAAHMLNQGIQTALTMAYDTVYNDYLIPNKLTSNISFERIMQNGYGTKEGTLYVTCTEIPSIKIHSTITDAVAKMKEMGAKLKSMMSGTTSLASD